eukprot:1883768-Prymnesium_polylepis.1
MLDILLFRPESGGSPDIVRESQRRRGADEAVVDAVVALDAAWRTAQGRVQQLRKELAARKKALSAVRSAPPAEVREELRQLNVRIAEAEAAEAAAHVEVQERVLSVGNLVHEHAPLSEPGASAPAVPDDAALRWLVEAGYAERADAAVGWRPVGPGVLLAHALLSRALEFAARRGFAPLSCPLAPPADRAA